MKNLFKYSIGVLFAGLTMTACSPEEFDGADPNGLPTVSGVDFNISVDQETNQMVANYTPQAGTYPIWILNGTQYSTLSEVGYNNPEAGTYSVELKLGNRNGISQASVSKNFTFNETKIDYSADFRRICDKEWRFANKEAAHLGCGPAGTAGTEWWSAAPDDKKDFGMYDDRITFTADTRKGGTFNYNAGEDGKTYVNTGTTKWGHEDADWDATIGNQTSTWSFEIYDWEDADGNVSKQTYIQLAPNTAFPYISSDAQYENPKFRIESMTAKKLVLVYETPDRSIAWHFIFTSEEAEKEWAGFDANSDCNMFKTASTNITFWYADENWSQLPDPTLTTNSGNDWSIYLPTANTQQWQTQMAFRTDMATNTSNNYDFSILLTADKDLNGATVKLTQDDNDDIYFFADRIDLKAGQEYIFWKSDMPGIDITNVKLVLDFGGCQAGTTIDISSFVLKEHGCNDGTVPPTDQPDDTSAATMDWNYEAGTNLWKAVDDGTLFDAFGYWFADDGWSQISNSECVHSGDTYEITIPDGIGGSQWQGQFHIDTKLTASASKAYNFYLVMEADNDCPGVTFKLTDAGDSNYFIEERNDVQADVPFILKREGVTLKEGTDAEAIRLFFDFGGSPAGTHVKISKIYFEEAITLNYDDADNLWKSVDDGSAFDAFGYWFADDGWTQISNSECVHSGNTYEITLPDGMGGSQWQGQFHIDTKLTASAAKSYAFQFDIESDYDLPQVTMKLTDAGDTNWFVEERHDVSADEVTRFTWKGVQTHEGADATAIRLFFDFGGSPAGAHVKISNIVFKEL